MTFVWELLYKRKCSHQSLKLAWHLLIKNFIQITRGKCVKFILVRFHEYDVPAFLEKLIDSWPISAQIMLKIDVNIFSISNMILQRPHFSMGINTIMTKLWDLDKISTKNNVRIWVLRDDLKLQTIQTTWQCLAVCYKERAKLVKTIDHHWL